MAPRRVPQVAIAPSDDGFQQFSFVNSIATTKGGTHVNHVADQVVEKVLEHLKKKHKGLEKTLKPAHVKAHLKVRLPLPLPLPLPITLTLTLRSSVVFVDITDLPP